MPYKYKVKIVNDQPLLADWSFIPGVGVIANGEISSPIKLENPALELVSGGEQPASTHLNGVVSQSAQVTPTTESDGNQ